ncbi:MAG: hypothetical protein J0L99_12135 [Chitinophagales bacterium]|nr:hypothetical protein [Chitinophagales bacterium]
MNIRLTLVVLLASLFTLLPRAVAAPPEEVKTGVYLMNLYDLNMDEHSFYADFYIWFKWKGKKDPTKIEFVNAIEKWSMEEATFDGDSTPVKLKDGYKYKIFRIEARFFHSFALNNFPLDKHVLDIQIENPEYPADSLIYVPDSNAAEIRRNLVLVGWEQKGCNVETRVHDYESNFGNAQENAQRYSNLSFTVALQRPFNYFLLKMLLPLFLVMLVSIGALLLHPTHIDTRSSLPIGGLLTAVFLQQSYSGALPDTGYMVLMDKVYLLGYTVISLVLLQVIRAGNALAAEADLKRVIRRERRLAWLYFLLFCAGTLLLSAWR